MSMLKTIWGTAFRLFPCPAPIGLRRIGTPGRDSPVLVTCNFDLTIKRLTRVLQCQAVWLLVADSKGVNVWCAAGAEELSTRTVVSVIRTSGIADQVDHRDLILPPFAAPGVRALDVEQQTGWSVSWGPIYADDIPEYLARGSQRVDAMKRVTYGWRERLDTGFGSLFPFYLIGAAGLTVFKRKLLPDYLAVGTATFVAFMLAAPYLPGKRGITKAALLDLLPAALLLYDRRKRRGSRLQTDLLMAMLLLLLWGAELGGLASTMPSDLDPLLARLGVDALGNVSFAGTMRTDLLNGRRQLTVNRERCESCGHCVEVCPLQLWRRDEQQRAMLVFPDDCTACTACVKQCKSGAIKAARVG